MKKILQEARLIHYYILDVKQPNYRLELEKKLKIQKEKVTYIILKAKEKKSGTNLFELMDEYLTQHSNAVYCISIKKSSMEFKFYEVAGS